MNVNEIESGFQIVGYNIAELTISNDFVYMDSNDETIERVVSAEYEVGDLFSINDNDINDCGTVTLDVDVDIKNDENETHIHIEIEGCFSSEDSDEDSFRNMLAVNGTAALYSIARGIISGTTSQMCTNGTVLIPMVNTYEMSCRVKE